MKRINCWEAKNCGRQSGGKHVDELGVCPASLPHENCEGVNKGKHCGRFCWTVAGTYCKGRIQGTFAKKFRDCLECEFFSQVCEDEGRDFILTPEDAQKKPSNEE